MKKSMHKAMAMPQMGMMRKAAPSMESSLEQCRAAPMLREQSQAMDAADSSGADSDEEEDGDVMECARNRDSGPNLAMPAMMEGMQDIKMQMNEEAKAPMEESKKEDYSNLGATYDNLINAQSTDGSWSVSYQAMLLSFLNGAGDAKQKIDQYLAGAEATIAVFVLTLLAEHILSQKFENKKSEWKMLAKKSNKWARKTRGQIGQQDELAQIEQVIKGIQF